MQYLLRNLEVENTQTYSSQKEEVESGTSTAHHQGQLRCDPGAATLTLKDHN